MKKRILQIVDSPNWAIATLANAVVRHNPQFEWRKIAVHPRSLERGEVDLQMVLREVEWADVVDVQYWRTLSQLLEKMPLLGTKLVLLTHHNEKNLLSYEWPENVWHVAKTIFSEKTLQSAGYKNIWYIPNSFDPDVFRWNPDWPPARPAVGYVGRIVSWKGLREICRACRELDVPLKVMGKHDDADYLASIPQEDLGVIEWEFFNCEDEARPEFYKNITVYCGNSGPGREVGTLGFIEALASGVPVVTTPSGFAADIGRDRENMIIVPFGEYDQLRDGLKEVLENPGLARELRAAGWQTIRNHNDEQMALAYSKVFYKMLSEREEPWVSVVIPATYERRELVRKIIAGLGEQSHRNLEAIIVWDEERDEPEDFKAPFPLRQLCIRRPGYNLYNLAMARNLGVIYAGGEILVFCDSRMSPAPDAVERFAARLGVDPEDKIWIFGEKGGGKETFVENFSAVRRRHLVDAGMFNERVDSYGGMSQELRSRFLAQGFSFLYLPEAKATPLCATHLTPERRRSIIRMKNLMARLGFNR